MGPHTKMSKIAVKNVVKDSSNKNNGSLCAKAAVFAMQISQRIRGNRITGSTKGSGRMTLIMIFVSATTMTAFKIRGGRIWSTGSDNEEGSDGWTSDGLC